MVANVVLLLINISECFDTSWSPMCHSATNTFATDNSSYLGGTQKHPRLSLRYSEVSLQHPSMTIWSMSCESITCLTPRSNQHKWLLKECNWNREKSAAEEPMTGVVTLGEYWAATPIHAQWSRRSRQHGYSRKWPQTKAPRSRTKWWRRGAVVHVAVAWKVAMEASVKENISVSV